MAAPTRAVPTRAARAEVLLALLLFLVFLSPALAAPPIAGDAVFDSIDSNDAIIDGVVTALAQDSAGFIWIGTPNGLVRFDGYRMRRFRSDPADPASLGDDFVRDLLPGADGTLWVATATGGLSRFDPRTGRFRQYRHDADVDASLAHDGVLALAPAHGEPGAIWVGTVGGLDYLASNASTFVHHRHADDDPATIAHNTIRSLLLDRRGDLWVGTRAGLSRRRAQAAGFEPMGVDAEAPGAAAGLYVYTLFEASDGRIWIGTQANGAAWIDPQDGSVHRLAVGEPDGGLSHPWISAIAEPRPGELWLATYGAGIDVVDAASARVIRRIRRDPAVQSSLAIDEITTLQSDRSGLLWIGSWGGGLQRFNPTASAFHTLHFSPTRPGALSHPTVLSALERPDGTLWIGTAGNGIDIVDRARGVIGGHRADRERAGALRDGTVAALAEGADGVVWVGTRQAGLHRFDPLTQAFEPIANANASSDTRVGSILVGQSGKLWLTAESGLAQFDPASGHARRVAMANGAVFGLPVTDLAEDGLGRLWVGTALGLLMQAPDATGLSWMAMPGSKADARAGNRVQALVVDDSQRLWVFGQRGLLHADVTQSQPSALAEVALSGQWGDRFRPGGLLADAHGRLWAQNFLIDPAAQRVIEFGRAEGADVGAVSEGMAARTRDGVLLFGGTRGLLLIDANAYRPWAFAPPVVVTDIELDGQSQALADPTAGLTLGAGGRRISVEFAALDYSAPLRNRYRYRLQPFDPDWIASDAEHRVATYGNLWPGDYTLLLNGSNRAGDWSSETVRIPIKVLPAYWQTWWFAALALALLLFIIVGAYRLRTARIRQRARELGLLVEQRSFELNAANQHLLETQQRLAVQEKMAALGSLVAGVAHEVSTPLGVAMTALSGIADAWKRLRDGVASGKLARPSLERLLGDGDEYTQLAIQNADRVAGLVSNLKAVVARRDSDRTVEIDLAVHLREAATLISGELQARGHRLEVDVPDELPLTTIPDALTEVLHRVLSNILDHAFPTDGGGLVRIAAIASDTVVEIEIADNGTGIPADALPQVFEPFFTTRRGINGRVGLGLHVAYNHVTQRLKGSIEIHSEPGQGTRVYIRLPR